MQYAGFDMGCVIQGSGFFFSWVELCDSIYFTLQKYHIHHKTNHQSLFTNEWNKVINEYNKYTIVA